MCVYLNSFVPEKDDKEKEMMEVKHRPRQRTVFHWHPE